MFLSLWAFIGGGATFMKLRICAHLTGSLVKTAELAFFLSQKPQKIREQKLKDVCRHVRTSLQPGFGSSRNLISCVRDVCELIRVLWEPDSHTVGEAKWVEIWVMSFCPQSHKSEQIKVKHICAPSPVWQERGGCFCPETPESAPLVCRMICKSSSE